MWDLIRALRAAAFCFSDAVVVVVGEVGEEDESVGVSLFEKRFEKKVMARLFCFCC